MYGKAVLFDLFDTLLLVEGGNAFYAPSLRRLHEFLFKNGIKVSFEEFSRAYFEAREKLYAEADKSLEEPHFNLRVSCALRLLGYNFKVSDEAIMGATMAFFDEFMRHVRLDADAIYVLHKLHGKYKLGLISNFAIPEGVEKLLKEFDLERFFDVILVSGAINRRKPAPEIFEKALRALDVDASETIFVGDSIIADVEGAKNIGAKSILIQRKTIEEIVNVKPDKTIKSLKELLNVLQDC